MRGFDYYTGIVFEVFDRHPENRRSLFGGGRYDELLALFGNEKVAAFGFGMGDVTIRDTLQTYNLLPEVKGGADIYVAVLDEKAFGYAQDIAQKLREDGKKVALDYSLKKVGDQIKTALKLHIPKLIVIGETEMNKGAYEIRDLNA
jgi:histidyl-tRNA synthetase